MSEGDTIALVRRGYEALGRLEVEPFLPNCDPELEFISLVGEVEGGSYRGHEGMRRFVSDLAEAWDVWEPVPRRFESNGDSVIATGRTRLRGKGSGVEITVEWGQVFRFRNGKLLWSRIYSDPAEARREYEALTAG